MILGFVSVGIFLVYVMIRIIRDEFERAALWNSRVLREEERLQKNWPKLYTSPKDIAELMEKFEEQELVSEFGLKVAEE